MDVISVPTEENVQKRELQASQNVALHARLLEFQENIKKKKFTRKDLGF